jgi:hypothetical protein
MGEDPLRYAAWRRGALFVSGGGGETLVGLGSRETSVCRLRWASSGVGRGANQSCGMAPVVGDGTASSEVREGDSMESHVVMGYTPVTAMTSMRSEALWRAPPPLAVLRMAAWTSWQAALWRVMRRAS